MRVSKQHFNDEQHTDSNSLTNALLAAPAKLSPVMTFLGGREDKKFPLTMLTEGVKNVKSINKSEYEYDVHTRVNHVRRLASTVGGGGGLGKGGSLFHLPFEDRWFINQYVLISESGIQVRIMGEPVPDGDRWLYPVRLVDPNPEMEFPASDLTAGSSFAQMFAPVGTDYSRGNASNWSAPAKVRHKLTTIRKSYQFSGKAKNFVADVELPKKGGGTSNFWMDYEEWQYYLQWKTECEMLYWYGRQSYNENGVTQMKDPDTGQPVVIGPGLLQQIQNKDTYSILTTKKLKNTIRDLFYGMTDAQNKQVTLYTGIGGAEEFDNALKEDLGNRSYQVLDNGKFVTGSGNALQLGGFFNTYQHIDGHTINVVKVPMFDHGPVADARAKHPVTGLSLESYRMVFVDQSNYDGEPNVQMVNHENREMLRWCVAGSVVPRGFDQNTSRASDIDGASVHFLKEGGIVLKRFDTSLDMECVIQ